MNSEIEVNHKDESEDGARRYELAVHFVPTVAEEALDVEVAFVRDAIEKAGGAVISEEWPKRFALAYTIEHAADGKTTEFDHSYFGWFRFTGSIEVAETVARAAEQSPHVLRSIVVRLGEESDRPRRRSVLIRTSHEALSPSAMRAAESVRTEGSAEAIDKEIEKLIVE